MDKLVRTDGEVRRRDRIVCCTRGRHGVMSGWVYLGMFVGGPTSARFRRNAASLTHTLFLVDSEGIQGRGREIYSMIVCLYLVLHLNQYRRIIQGLFSYQSVNQRTTLH